MLKEKVEKNIGKAVGFCKEHQNDIVLVLGVFLIAMLCFAAGYIVAKQEGKQPLKFEYYNEQIQDSDKNRNKWSGNNRALSGMEIG